jgi:hypothetical protein
VLGSIEYCWNVFPSTVFSSGLLLVCHGILLIGVLRSETLEGGECGKDVVEEKKLS